MPLCIQTLESRCLFSVNAMTLAYDLSAAKVDATADRVAVYAIASRSSADLKALKADLKGTGEANQALLKTVQSAENQYVGNLNTDVNALLQATGLAQQGAADGMALLRRPSTRRVAEVKADIAALIASTPGPLAAIRVDEQSTAVSDALSALLAANSSNPALAADAKKLNTDNSVIGATIIADSQDFKFTLDDLETHLLTLVA